MSAAFETLQRLLRRETGISIDDSKTYLAESRLSPLMAARSLKSLAELLRRIDGGDRALLDETLQAMTTNETMFFRDRAPFEGFRNAVLPRLLRARAASRRLRIWCAACATGQEPYSLAMILDEQARQLAGWHVELVATDLSRRVVDLARGGVYNQFEVQRGLPIALLLRYFRQEGESWRISPHLRSRVTFQTQNLMTSFRELGTFDVIFCRNVLIYFDVATKRSVLARLAEALAPDGSLCLGATETIAGLSDGFVHDPTCRSFVMRPPAETAA